MKVVTRHRRQEATLKKNKFLLTLFGIDLFMDGQRKLDNFSLNVRTNYPRISKTAA